MLRLMPTYGLRRFQKATALKHITRNRRLTPEEAAKNRTIREQVAEELPGLIARHHQWMESLDQLQELLK